MTGGDKSTTTVIARYTWSNMNIFTKIIRFFNGKERRLQKDLNEIQATFRSMFVEDRGQVDWGDTEEFVEGEE